MPKKPKPRKVIVETLAPHEVRQGAGAGKMPKPRKGSKPKKKPKRGGY